MKYLKGKAKVFEGDRPAFEAIQAGEIVPGDIIVIRYEGCKGAPGMKELMLSIDALIGLGLHKSVGLITDARFSGFNYGAIMVQLSGMYHRKHTMEERSHLWKMGMKS